MVVLGFVLALVLTVSLGGILVGALSIPFQLSGLRARRIVERTPVVPCGQWQPGARRLATTGRLVHSYAGPLVAPISGTPCVWYFAELTRQPGRSRWWGDEPPGFDQLWEQRSPAPPALRDSTGMLLIHPAMLSATRDETLSPVTETTSRTYRLPELAGLPDRIPWEVVQDTHADETLTLTERVVRGGHRVYALGGAVAEGPYTMLAHSRHGPLSILTRQNREQVIRTLAAGAVEDRLVGAWMFAGGLLVTAVAGSLLWLAATGR